MSSGPKKSKNVYQSGKGSLGNTSQLKESNLKITFQNRIPLSDPTKVDMISGVDLSYIKTRNRLSAFNAVHTEFRKSGLSQKQLAMKLNDMDQGRLSKLLGAPGNWTLDTVAELLWATSGARLAYTLDYPLKKARRNDTRPHYLDVPIVTKPKPAGIDIVSKFDSPTSTGLPVTVRLKEPA
ncbi:MAG: hypothetical protein M9924_16110 [Rhizobiaceae bacterium]|nr:hypothetical protein [Rhizobiaceae bacterium]